MRKPLVYVAGPITGDPWGCVRRGTDAFRALREIGCVPFLPQLSVLHEMVDPQPYEAWLAYDFDVIEHCDALLRLHGDSAGADREIAHAEALGIPVHRGHVPLAWVARWRHAQIVEEAGPPAAALDTPETVYAAVSGEPAPTNQETQHG